MARILIVEDELVAAHSIQEFLAGSEHNVLAVVVTAQEAIQFSARDRPDLVLMDIHLKGAVDGITAARQIYQEWGIPVIYLSADTDSRILERALTTDPFGYLVKPFGPTELLIAVNIALHRHRLEAQLEKTEQWLSTTLTSIGDGTISTDREGRITFINPAAEELTGWSQPESLGQPVEQVLNLIDSETQETIANPLIQAMQEGKPITLTDGCILITRQGSERAIGDAATPIRNRKGEITGAVLVFRDVTGRKREEELLHRRQQEFRALVENSPDIVVRFDRNLRHLYVNSAMEQLTGIPVNAFIGKTNRELGMPESLVTSWDKALHQVFLTGEEQTIEFDLMTVNGMCYFQSRIVPEFAQNGEVQTLLGVTRDITDRRKTEEALRVQAEREELLSTITQRIRESLELEDVLNTTVSEIQQLLKSDRVVIYRFEPDWSGFVTVEAKQPGWISLLGRKIDDPCLASEACILPFTRGAVGVINNVDASELAECYLDLLRQFQVKANLVIPILNGEQLWGLLAVQQCSNPRTWEEWEIDFLVRLSHKLSIAIQQSELYKQTQQLAQREQSLNRVIQIVRNSLDLSTVFHTTVFEIGVLLKVDQANILQFFPDQGLWVYIETYCKNPEQIASYVGLEIPDEGNPYTAVLKRGEIFQTDNARFLDDEFSQILAETFPGAWLKVPLQVSGQLWGCISLVKHEQPFDWQDWQIDLTRAIADQLAIAIHQSELYREVQWLNADLENQVSERTALLEQSLAFEAMLKRITDKVRDSLDENQILQTVVEELGCRLGVEYCGSAIYNTELTAGRITHQYSASAALLTENREILIEDDLTYSIYQQLFQAQHCQFCLCVPNPERPTEQNHTILACPILDNQGVLGDLWLFKPVTDVFSESEIRLVEQVANHCAIAIRQSRLFQESQAQVVELERLNRLKDDFLSTISHELRTPMANIKMAIQMLEIVLRPLGVFDTNSTPAQRYFQVLRTECNREISLIDNLLKLSQFDTQAEQLTFSTVEMHFRLKHAIEPHLEQIQNRQQILELQIPDQPISLETDLSCLNQILDELISNACKYSPIGGTIRISAQATSENVQVRITNTGIEIAPAEIPRIFDQFYRVPQADPWQYSGTGIGLALVKKLINLLQASIAVESGDNQVTFILTLPYRVNSRTDV